MLLELRGGVKTQEATQLTDLIASLTKGLFQCCRRTEADDKRMFVKFVVVVVLTFIICPPIR